MIEPTESAAAIAREAYAEGLKDGAANIDAVRRAENELAAVREQLRQVTVERDEAFQDAERARATVRLATGDPETYAYQVGKKTGRKDAVADVLRFMREEERKFGKGSRDPDLTMDGRVRCGVRASLLETLIGQIGRGDHERHP